MKWIEVGAQRAAELAAEPGGLPAEGFLWLDVLHDEAQSNPEGLRDAVQRVVGARIDELHLQDAANLQHPSYFDSTSTYDMLVFRKLAVGEVRPLEEKSGTADKRRMLQEIVTRPITFFLFERLLVTVRQDTSKTMELLRQRLLDPKVRADASERSRLPKSPGELMLRMLNGMVDRYLELREPLSDRLDRWQRDLLDPRRPFNNWSALLEARIELRKLEHLCEGQHDALTELRDSYLEDTPDANVNDAYLVRLNDVLEHIHRVLHHAQRLEASAESAVQLHFSANTHQTNEIVRKLTAIAAIFAPLTLISGIFGMNFHHMPLLAELDGFWWTIATMAAIVIVMLLYFWARRILERPRTPRPPRWLR
ncbi:MAG TPA: magnesium transporter CorA family protein [Burkholderiaceae bacterium]|nr:magnesium transporter CorA family protein [Burkholderiaceae bacterium]